MAKTITVGTQHGTHRTVGIGDWVEFKADVEQQGKILDIIFDWKGIEFTLENLDGFDGDYIGGETTTTVEASRCW